MATTTTTAVPVKDAASPIPKAQHRPPALLLEEHDQAHPGDMKVQGSSKPKQSSYGVIQRLQELLPNSFTPHTAYYTASSETPQPERKHVKSPRSASMPSVRWDLARLGTREGKSLATEPPQSSSTTFNVKGLKVRMLTWNMHDSLPKGELEELLGKVLPYSPNPVNPPGTFPILSEEPDHPYHFVVIAGQECPSLSGVPMALGAGFKLREKEKERASFDKDDSDRSLRPQSRPKEGNRSPDSQHSEVYRAATKNSNYSTTSGLDEFARQSPDPLQITIPQPPPAGWTSVVEDWLCNGGTFELPKAPKTPKIVEVVGNVVTRAVPGTPALALKRTNSIKEPKKGPYQFLAKERLMGIYLAIYVHRDLKPLIKGTSKSAVTAGLIGGRVGNKGGVGISVNLDGTTLLFLNCHLAAHEGRVNHRLANLAKIKAELEVDDFLPANDPRKKSEDPTDRFDFTFLCGDLNFRLDVTRLHADWLIARQDYEQALGFDQLLKVMKEGAKEFAGFKEAPINFPPTFKYDVLRTLKRTKRLGDNEDELDDPDAEAMSISSLSTSYSRATDLDFSNATALQGSPSTPSVPHSASRVSLSNIVHAQKAKLRFISLKSPNLFSGLSSPLKSNSKRQSDTAGADGGSFVLPASPSSTVVDHYPPTPQGNQAMVVPPTPPPVASSQTVEFSSLVPPPKLKVESMASGVGSGSQENLDADRGVYDTSNKKRVPSWCDRILWKTTVEPSLLSASPTEPVVRHALLSPPPPKSTGIRALFRAKSARVTRRPPALALPSTSANLKDTNTNNPTNDSYLPPLKTAPPLSQTIVLSVDDKTGAKGPITAVAAAPSSLSATHGTFPRRTAAMMSAGATIVSPPPSAPAGERANRRSTAFGVLMSPLSGGNGGAGGGSSNAHGSDAPLSRWRFLPNFLSPNSYHHHHHHGNARDSGESGAGEEQLVTPLVTPAIVRRRGDVVCLDYSTLDDRQMRRLEGRSDHRPVLGTFVVYI